MLRPNTIMATPDWVAAWNLTKFRKCFEKLGEMVGELGKMDKNGGYSH